MIGVAAGLALEGYRPIVHSYTPFLVERPYEQIKLDLGHRTSGRCSSRPARRTTRRQGRTHQAPRTSRARGVARLDDRGPGHVDEVERMLARALESDDRVYIRLTDETNHAPLDGERLVVCAAAREALFVLAVGPTLAPVLEATVDRDVDGCVPLARAAVRRRRATGCGRAAQTSCSSSRTSQAPPPARSRALQRPPTPAARARRRRTESSATTAKAPSTVPRTGSTRRHPRVARRPKRRLTPLRCQDQRRRPGSAKRGPAP